MTDKPIHIRQATVADAAAVQAIYAYYVTDTIVSFEDIVPGVAEIGDRVQAVLDAGYPYLIADRGSEVIGYAYSSLHRTRHAYRFSVDVSVYVARGAERRGIGRHLYGTLLPELAERGFHMAYAGISLPNEGSIGLHEAMGFGHLGTFHQVGFKFGQWHDVGWWEKALR